VSLTLDGAANDGFAGETDNLIAIENLSGGVGNDTLVGDGSSNELDGSGGSDVVAGQGGNDVLRGDGLSGVPIRGGAPTGPTNDTVIGGEGRDELDCGSDVDVGIRDPRDEVSVNCERIGADVTSESAPVTGKKNNQLKLTVACPESEGAKCVGKLKLTSNDKKIGKGKFTVGAGKSKQAKVKLSKKGVKTLKKAGGSLLVEASAFTDEPGGVSESAARVLIFR
jgi:hypothetical protein